MTVTSNQLLGPIQYWSEDSEVKKILSDVLTLIAIELSNFEGENPIVQVSSEDFNKVMLSMFTSDANREGSRKTLKFNNPALRFVVETNPWYKGQPRILRSEESRFHNTQLT